MRAVPLGPSVELPTRPRNAVLGGESHAGGPLEPPTGPRNAVPGGGAHADGATGAWWSSRSMGPRSAILGVGQRRQAVALGPFGGAPYAVTKRRIGWWLTHAGGATGAFRWSSLRGHETLYWVVRDACGRCHWDLRWSSLWGHETLCWVVRDACGRSHWGLRWSSLWGHETLCWVVRDACGRSHWGLRWSYRWSCMGRRTRSRRRRGPKRIVFAFSRSPEPGASSPRARLPRG